MEHSFKSTFLNKLVGNIAGLPRLKDGAGSQFNKGVDIEFTPSNVLFNRSGFKTEKLK